MSSSMSSGSAAPMTDVGVSPTMTTTDQPSAPITLSGDEKQLQQPEKSYSASYFNMYNVPRVGLLPRSFAQFHQPMLSMDQDLAPQPQPMPSMDLDQQSTAQPQQPQPAEELPTSPLRLWTFNSSRPPQLRYPGASVDVLLPTVQVHQRFMHQHIDSCLVYNLARGLYDRLRVARTSVRDFVKGVSQTQCPCREHSSNTLELLTGGRLFDFKNGAATLWRDFMESRECEYKLRWCPEPCTAREALKHLLQGYAVEVPLLCSISVPRQSTTPWAELAIDIHRIASGSPSMLEVEHVLVGAQVFDTTCPEGKFVRYNGHDDPNWDNPGTGKAQYQGPETVRMLWYANRHAAVVRSYLPNESDYRPFKVPALQASGCTIHVNFGQRSPDTPENPSARFPMNTPKTKDTFTFEYFTRITFDNSVGISQSGALALATTSYSEEKSSVGNPIKSVPSSAFSGPLDTQANVEPLVVYEVRSDQATDSTLPGAFCPSSLVQHPLWFLAYGHPHVVLRATVYATRDPMAHPASASSSVYATHAPMAHPASASSSVYATHAPMAHAPSASSSSNPQEFGFRINYGHQNLLIESLAVSLSVPVQTAPYANSSTAPSSGNSYSHEQTESSMSSQLGGGGGGGGGGGTCHSQMHRVLRRYAPLCGPFADRYVTAKTQRLRHMVFRDHCMWLLVLATAPEADQLVFQPLGDTQWFTGAPPGFAPEDVSELRQLVCDLSSRLLPNHSCYRSTPLRVSFKAATTDTGTTASPDPTTLKVLARRLREAVRDSDDIQKPVHCLIRALREERRRNVLDLFDRAKPHLLLKTVFDPTHHRGPMPDLQMAFCELIHEIKRQVDKLPGDQAKAKGHELVSCVANGLMPRDTQNPRRVEQLVLLFQRQKPMTQQHAVMTVLKCVLRERPGVLWMRGISSLWEAMMYPTLATPPPQRTGGRVLGPNTTEQQVSRGRQCFQEAMSVCAFNSRTEEMLRLAAVQGYQPAYVTLALWYTKLRCDKANVEYFAAMIDMTALVVARSSDPYASVAQGLCYLNGWQTDWQSETNRRLRAKTCFKRATDCAAGAYHLAMMELDERPEESLQLLDTAVQQGYCPAMVARGQHWEAGTIGGVNFDKAAELYKRAVEQQHAPAMYHLGLLYQQGRGVPKDFEMASNYIRSAARQLHQPAWAQLVSGSNVVRLNPVPVFPDAQALMPLSPHGKCRIEVIYENERYGVKGFFFGGFLGMKTWMPTSLDSGTPRWSNISDFEGNPRSKDSEVDNPSKWVAVTAFKPFTEWKYSHPKSILNYSGTAKRHGGVRRREHRRVLTQHSASKPRLEAGRSFLAVVYAYANHKAHLLRLSLHEKTTVTTDAPSGTKILAAMWEPLNEDLPAVECTAHIKDWTVQFHFNEEQQKQMPFPVPLTEPLEAAGWQYERSDDPSAAHLYFHDDGIVSWMVSEPDADIAYSTSNSDADCGAWFLHCLYLALSRRPICSLGHRHSGQCTVKPAQQFCAVELEEARKRMLHTERLTSSLFGNLLGLENGYICIAKPSRVGLSIAQLLWHVVRSPLRDHLLGGRVHYAKETRPFHEVQWSGWKRGSFLDYFKLRHWPVLENPHVTELPLLAVFALEPDGQCYNKTVPMVAPFLDAQAANRMTGCMRHALVGFVVKTHGNRYSCTISWGATRTSIWLRGLNDKNYRRLSSNKHTLDGVASFDFRGINVRLVLQDGVARFEKVFQDDDDFVALEALFFAAVDYSWGDLPVTAPFMQELVGLCGPPPTAKSKPDKPERLEDELEAAAKLMGDNKRKTHDFGVLLRSLLLGLTQRPDPQADGICWDWTANPFDPSSPLAEAFKKFAPTAKPKQPTQNKSVADSDCKSPPPQSTEPLTVMTVRFTSDDNKNCPVPMGASVCAWPRYVVPLRRAAYMLLHPHWRKVVTTLTDQVPTATVTLIRTGSKTVEEKSVVVSFSTAAMEDEVVRLLSGSSVSSGSRAPTPLPERTSNQVASTIFETSSSSDGSTAPTVNGVSRATTPATVPATSDTKQSSSDAKGPSVPHLVGHLAAPRAHAIHPLPPQTWRDFNPHEAVRKYLPFIGRRAKDLFLAIYDHSSGINPLKVLQQHLASLPMPADGFWYATAQTAATRPYADCVRAPTLSTASALRTRVQTLLAARVGRTRTDRTDEKESLPTPTSYRPNRPKSHAKMDLNNLAGARPGYLPYVVEVPAWNDMPAIVARRQPYKRAQRLIHEHIMRGLNQGVVKSTDPHAWCMVHGPPGCGRRTALKDVLAQNNRVTTFCVDLPGFQSGDDDIADVRKQLVWLETESKRLRTDSLDRVLPVLVLVLHDDLQEATWTTVRNELRWGGLVFVVCKSAIRQVIQQGANPMAEVELPQLTLHEAKEFILDLLPPAFPEQDEEVNELVERLARVTRQIPRHILLLVGIARQRCTQAVSLNQVESKTKDQVSVPPATPTGILRQLLTTLTVYTMQKQQRECLYTMAMKELSTRFELLFHQFELILPSVAYFGGVIHKEFAKYISMETTLRSPDETYATLPVFMCRALVQRMTSGLNWRCLTHSDLESRQCSDACQLTHVCSTHQSHNCFRSVRCQQDADTVEAASVCCQHKSPFCQKKECVVGTAFELYYSAVLRLSMGQERRVDAFGREVEPPSSQPRDLRLCNFIKSTVVFYPAGGFKYNRNPDKPCQWLVELREYQTWAKYARARFYRGLRVLLSRYQYGRGDPETVLFPAAPQPKRTTLYQEEAHMDHTFLVLVTRYVWPMFKYLKMRTETKSLENEITAEEKVLAAPVLIQGLRWYFAHGHSGRNLEHCRELVEFVEVHCQSFLNPSTATLSEERTAGRTAITEEDRLRFSFYRIKSKSKREGHPLGKHQHIRRMQQFVESEAAWLEDPSAPVTPRDWAYLHYHRRRLRVEQAYEQDAPDKTRKMRAQWKELLDEGKQVLGGLETRDDVEHFTFLFNMEEFRFFNALTATYSRLHIPQSNETAEEATKIWRQIPLPDSHKEFQALKWYSVYWKRLEMKDSVESRKLGVDHHGIRPLLESLLHHLTVQVEKYDGKSDLSHVLRIVKGDVATIREFVQWSDESSWTLGPVLYVQLVVHRQLAALSQDEESCTEILREHETLFGSIEQDEYRVSMKVAARYEHAVALMMQRQYADALQTIVDPQWLRVPAKDELEAESKAVFDKLPDNAQDQLGLYERYETWTFAATEQSRLSEPLAWWPRILWHVISVLQCTTAADSQLPRLTARFHMFMLSHACRAHSVGASACRMVCNALEIPCDKVLSERDMTEWWKRLRTKMSSPKSRWEVLKHLGSVVPICIDAKSVWDLRSTACPVR